MKTCRQCSEAKPLTEFYATSGGRGTMGKCKACWKAIVTERRRTNPAVQQYDRERAKLPQRRAKSVDDVKRWRREHPDLYRAQNAINNAIRDGKLNRGRCGDCGTDKNVFGIATDPDNPLAATWRCALCHHRGRFAATSVETGISL